MKLVLLLLILGSAACSAATFNYSGVVDAGGVRYRVKYMVIDAVKPFVSGIVVYPESANRVRWAVRFDVKSKSFFLDGPEVRPVMKEESILVVKGDTVDFQRLPANQKLREMMRAKQPVSPEIQTLLSGKKKQPIQTTQRNAGSRPSSMDFFAFETPSSLGPRG